MSCLPSLPKEKNKKQKTNGKGPHAHLSTKNKSQSESAHITDVHQTNENKLPMDCCPIIPPPPPQTPWPQSFSHYKSHLSPVQKPVLLTSFLNFHLSIKPDSNSNRCPNSRGKQRALNGSHTNGFLLPAAGPPEVQFAQDPKEHVAERKAAFSVVTIKRAKREEKS